MHLIFIYGPPSVNKLKVAEELSERTGFKIFNNHETVKMLTRYFEIDKAFWDLQKGIRLGIFSHAAYKDVDLIYTTDHGAYNPEDTHLQQVTQTITSEGGTVHFVQLLAHMDTVMEQAERNDGGGDTEDTLERITMEEEYFQETKAPGHLVLYTDDMTAREVADKIANGLDIGVLD